jgi:hypothetical protein
VLAQVVVNPTTIRSYHISDIDLFVFLTPSGINKQVVMASIYTNMKLNDAFFKNLQILNKIIIKNQKYHTVGTIPKSNIKIVERSKIDISNTQIHGRSFSWLETGTSK